MWPTYHHDYWTNIENNKDHVVLYRDLLEAATHIVRDGQDIISYDDDIKVITRRLNKGNKGKGKAKGKARDEAMDDWNRLNLTAAQQKMRDLLPSFTRHRDRYRELRYIGAQYDAKYTSVNPPAALANVYATIKKLLSDADDVVQQTKNI